IELCLSHAGKRTFDYCTRILGAELPTMPWQAVVAGEVRTIWVGSGRWHIIGDRTDIAAIHARLLDKIGPACVFDLTGAFSCLRIVGTTANEILMRVCPLALGEIEPDEARGTSIGGVRA